VSASRKLEELLVFGSNLGVVLMKRLCLVTAMMFAASIAQAGPITSFNNLDFDAGPPMGPPFNGFDQATTDVPGWTNANGGTLADSGIEGPAAWWIDDAYPNSNAGDVYDISYLAQRWQWTGDSAWTATLFYDNPANVIGSYTQAGLPDLGQWAPFTSPGIAATPASVGGTLGILVASSGPADSFANIDEVVVNLVPEPATFGLAGVCGAALLAFRRRAVC
jgi:hypothetical protein